MNSVLIIDDIPDNIKLLSQTLKNSGYHVRSSASASHALKSIEKEKPDLVLLDIMMPQIDGFQLCQTLKQKEETKNIAVIFLSALDDMEHKLKGFHLGGVDYITKPFSIDEVIARVKIHLKLHENKKNQDSPVKYKNSTLSDEQKEEMLSAIIKYMEEENPFLDIEFTIEKMADVLGLSRHHISEVINQKTDKNFNQFINEYRILHVTQLMSLGKHKTLTILGLAYDSGFNSKSTFNSAFKTVMNMTPSEYLQKIQL